MYPVTYLYLCITAGLTALVLVPPVSLLAVRIGGIDRPDERKVHQEEVPRLGGVAIFMACLFSLLIFTDMRAPVKGYLAGGAIIFFTGLADDITGLTPSQKLIGELAAALLVVISGGVCLTSLGNLFGTGELLLGWAALPFTVFAIVGITNAINLLDGLDGLAGGVTAVVSAAFCLLAWRSGNMPLLLISTALLGGVLGFLKYNTHPAKIFMGDSGSLFLGYSLGVCSVLLVTGGNHRISPMLPVFLLGVPIFDTLFVMGNRLRKKQPLFLPDRSHLHHRLMDLGLGHTSTVFVVYGATYLLCFAALFMRQTEDWLLLLVFFGFFAACYLCIKALLNVDALDKIKTLWPSADPTFLTLRKLVSLSSMVVTSIKYLLLFLLILSWSMPSVRHPWIMVLTALLLIATLTSACISSKWSNTLLQTVLYAGSALVIFLMDTTGRSTVLYGISMHLVDTLLCGMLVILIALEVLIRRRAGLLTTTPFEYFILFILVLVPLLPEDLVARYHLFAVTGKSVVVFVAYKLILMDNMVQNRKIILALAVALLGYLVRPIFN